MNTRQKYFLFGLLAVALVVQFSTTTWAGELDVQFSNWTRNISLLVDPQGEYHHYDPKVVASENYVHIAWYARHKDVWPQLAIFYARSRDGGKTFDMVKKLFECDDGALVFHPEWKNVDASSRYVHIFFWRTTIPNKIMYLRSENYGTTFNSEPIVFASAEGNSSLAGIYIDADQDNLFVARGWSVPYDARYINFSSSSDGGATFQHKQIARSETAYRLSVVDMVRSGDYVYVLTVTEDVNYYKTPVRIKLWSSHDRGQTFNDPVKVTVPAVNGNDYAVKIQDHDYSPNIIANGATVNIVWLNNDNPGVFDGWWAPTLRTRRSTDGGLTLSEPIILHTYPAGYHSGANRGLETIAGSGDNLYIATVISSESHGTYLWRSTDGGATWNAAQRISSGGWWTHIGVAPAFPANVHLTNSWYYRSNDYGLSLTGGVNPHLNFNSWVSPSFAMGADGVAHYAAWSNRNYPHNSYDAHIYYRRIAPEPGPRRADKSLSLTKTGSARRDNIQIPGSAKTNFTSAMSVEFWVMPIIASGSYYQEMLSKKKGTSSFGTYMLGVWDNPEGQVYGRLITDQANATTGAWMGTGIPLPQGEWTHLAMTYDADLAQDNWKIYVNGTLEAQQNLQGNILIDELDSPLVIGDDSGVHWVIGAFTIDDLRLWNRALSQEEIAAGMLGTVAINSPGLAAFYTFNDTFKDSVPGGYDAMPMFYESFVPSTLRPSSPSASPGVLMLLLNEQ